MIELLLLLITLSAAEVVTDSADEQATPAVIEAVAEPAQTPTETATPAPAPSSPPPRTVVEPLADKQVDIATPATNAEPTRGLQLVRADERMASQGKQMRVEVLRQDSDERRPAILILHGASGIGDGAFYRNAAEIFAERGFITFIPHYFQATPPKSGFKGQERVLSDLVEAVAQNRYVDPAKIGVFGLSLGGFHALNLSSRDARIAAVVDMSGALVGNTIPASNRLAPTLALHGAKDRTVPVARARSLAKYLKQMDVPHELVIYNDQGHFFRGKAQQDALQRSAAFFGGYLSKPTQDSGSRTVQASPRAISTQPPAVAPAPAAPIPNYYLPHRPY